MTLLEFRDFSVEYETERGTLRAVDHLDLTVRRGETLGVVGESGCGKTTTMKPVLGILDDNGRVTSGELLYEDRNLLELSESELRREIRWTEIAYIPQNAMAALDPVFTVGAQVDEVILEHTDRSKAQARERTEELFESVGLDVGRTSDYPHELSGGQRQRVTIALALALEPSLVIADEPTTGLDVVVQDEILELIAGIQAEIGCALVFITHDLSVVGEISDRLAILYAGRVVELGSVADVFAGSAHPYTIGLQNAFPRMERNPDEGSIITIPGTPPDPTERGAGCSFADRCPFATEECERDPEFVEVDDDHWVECHYPEKADEFRERGGRSETWQRPSGGAVQ